jgi:DNA-binding CsgD family transcriptional regulator
MKTTSEHFDTFLESPRAPRCVFVHFLDHEIFYTFGLHQRNQQRVESEFRFAFRIALLLAADNVILPASHFFESPLARQILQEHGVFAEFGYISLASNTLNVGEFLQQKQQQYGVELDRYPLYFEATPSTVEAESPTRWVLKSRNTTKDITSSWMESIGDSKTWESVYNHSHSPSTSAFENDLVLVPEKLQANAFIADFVTPLIPVKKEAQEVTERYINILIQRAYIDSFLKTYNAACLDDFTIFDTSVILPVERPRYSVSKAKRYFLMKNKLLDFVMFATAPQLLHFKLSEQWCSLSDAFITYTEERQYTNAHWHQKFEERDSLVSQTPSQYENNSTSQTSSYIQPSAYPVLSTLIYPDGLTKREVEVLRLVATGLTDTQVAEQLVISPRTVHAHLSSIYSKLGISSRSAATLYALEHGLL